MDDKKNKAATPLVEPYDRAKSEEAPAPVDTDAPVSTDEHGQPVDLPDLGGHID